jgi:hypothetical protein
MNQTEHTITLDSILYWEGNDNTETSCTKTTKEPMTVFEITEVFYNFLLGQGYSIDDIIIVKENKEEVSIKNGCY